MSSQNYRYWGTIPRMEQAKKPLHLSKNWCANWRSVCDWRARAFAVPYGQMATTGRRRRLTQRGPWGILEWPAQALPPRAEPAAHQVVPAKWHVAPLCNRDQIRLRDHFKDRLITKAVGVEWCSYSPALTPPDFFL